MTVIVCETFHAEWNSRFESKAEHFAEWIIADGTFIDLLEMCRSLAWPTVHNRKRREHNKRLLDRHMRYFRNVLLTLVINTIPRIVSDSFYCGVCVFEWSDCCAMTENLIKIRLFWKAFNYKTENPFQWIVGCWTPHAIMQWWWLWEKQIILFPFGELCHFTLCWWRPELSYGLFCHQIFDGRARICCAFDASFYFGT